MVAASVFGLDECVKRWAEKCRETEDRIILHGRIILRKHHNRGICLNLLDHRQSFVTFLSAALTALVAARIFQIRKDASKTWYAAGLSLILGGALSNTWDRIHRKYVVDYFSFNCKREKIRDIVFNLSDLFIFAGSLFSGMWYTVFAEDIRRLHGRKEDERWQRKKRWCH